MYKTKNNKSYLFLIISFLLISCASNFDKEIWKNDIIKREEMVSDLTINILPGLSKNDIISILGKSETLHFNKSDLVYNLGVENSFFSIDNKWLLIYMDKKGVFDRFEIKTD